MKVREIDVMVENDEGLLKISKDNLLALNLEEMRTIQQYFRKERRNPTDVELETIAQTWSEHCKHKTLAGNIEYREGNGEPKVYHNLLKSTIFRATKELNKPWCISVFEDNAGIIEFTEEYAVAFKVETHNHPSALEPYGGAGTGIGGVIRDILGVGLGAKPILNTDVFCFGNLDQKYKDLPEGVLHPKRILKGVVSGVRDYGNRMGIPTVNGAVLFDRDYACNPLVFCGTVGIIPKTKAFKKVTPGCLVVSVGGRTGRDGIHGATFSSLGLDKDTPLSPVQIGNPVTEKKVTDTILKARDEELFSAITDCGAGGFSSAIGELGSEGGVRVHLERAPLKYKGIEPWEIWVSEAQERMILAVPQDKIKRLLELFEKEDVETTVLGEFTDTGRLEVLFNGKVLCNLDNRFLHDGLPKSTRKAVWNPAKLEEPVITVRNNDYTSILKKILAAPNVCSKEWIIRQYDHEVQAQTVIKPLQGKAPYYDGPGDACVAYPQLETGSADRYKGIAVGCGINPNYGKIDPYWMTASVIDEALRNIVAVGGDVGRAALLDNFCWGNCSKPGQLAGVVKAAEACYDFSKAFGTPFISGKDSLNNEFIDEHGAAVSIPGTMLVSAIAIVQDIRKVTTMDIKAGGDLIYIVGDTKDELGGSQYYALHGHTGKNLPKVDAAKAKRIMESVQKAISGGLIRACHDCSDGGLGVALAEMAFAGGYGMDIDLAKVPVNEKAASKDAVVLFSESNSRFVVEVAPENKGAFEAVMKDNVFACLGRTGVREMLTLRGLDGTVLVEETLSNLKKAWKSTLADL